jgi:hypothetical protein
MARKLFNGEIIVTDWDLMGKFYNHVYSGKYEICTMYGITRYNAVASTRNDRVVISRVVATDNGPHEIVRFLKRDEKVRLVPTERAFDRWAEASDE